MADRKKLRARSKRDKLDREGEMKPDISVKVDELFIRWFNLPQTQRMLKDGLRQIRQKHAKADGKVRGEENPTIDHHPQRTDSPPPSISADKPLLSPRRKSFNRNSLSSSLKLNGAPPSPTDVKASRKIDSNQIPKFYFPTGEPKSTDELRNTLKNISSAFDSIGKSQLTAQELAPIAKACGCPTYWKSLIFKASCSVPDASTVSKQNLLSTWKRVASSCHDDASRFVRMLAKPGKNHLEFQDFMVLLQDVVESHPGLIFLREAPEFHTRYMNTVIARIFYAVNRSWSGRITASELRKSNFLQVLNSLEHEEDINAVSDFFSYEHFYVIYCKFWELDTDHDLVIDRNDLRRHANGALSSRLIERVLCGAVTRWDASDHRTQKMSYVDFVWFLISEEDKKSPTSIEYWFRCMDLDGDGRISMYEMEYFYEEQIRKLEQLDIEPLPFEDCICQMLDMVKPVCNEHVTLKDLKNCKMAHVFFDTFFNIEKYLEHEQKDPFAPQKDVDSECSEPSDWERYAMEEYDILVAEEQANENQAAIQVSYEDDDPLIDEEFKRLGLDGVDASGDRLQQSSQFQDFLQ